MQEGFYSNRTDLIRTAIRNQLERHADVTGGPRPGRASTSACATTAATTSRRRVASGEPLHIRVLGLASIAGDVTPELARATIASVEVLGALHASPAVKAALADRTR